VQGCRCGARERSGSSIRRSSTRFVHARAGIGEGWGPSATAEFCWETGAPPPPRLLVQIEFGARIGHDESRSPNPT
jgi:hypothetical protein